MNIAIDRRFMMRHPAHVIALGFGAGLSLWAPGTVGTLWAWASFAVLHLYFDAIQLAWLIGLSLPLGWWSSTVTARNLGVSDPGNIVWDEIVAFWLVLWPSFGLLCCFVFSTPPSPARWAGPTDCSKALVGALALASCSMTWWPLFAPCW